MPLPDLSFGHRMEMVTIRETDLHRLVPGQEIPKIVHFSSVDGQDLVPALCGWEGGRIDPRDRPTEVTCPACLAIVAFFDNSRKGRRPGT